MRTVRERKTKTRKSFIWFMAAALALGCFGGFSRMPGANAAVPAWPAPSASGYNMPYGPKDGLVTTQNPPDFHWPWIANADKYRLQVGRAADLSVAEYDEDELTNNFYNFSHALDPGTWYWRVRYHAAGASAPDDWSAWSDVRKFRIDGDNDVAFPVPSVDDLLDEIGSGHPRIWTTAETLADFRSLKATTGKTLYEKKLASVTAALNEALPSEPIFPYPPSHPRDADYESAQTALRQASDKAVDKMADAAFLYLVTGNADYAAEAKRRLISIAEWNPNGSTSYAQNDQVHRYIALRSAMAYDWIYDYPLFAEGEKADVRAMIVARTETMYDELVTAHPLRKTPFDSHGWTNFGYVGLIAIALLHDAPEAEDWFRGTVPDYINFMPPWGGEDGGWSQGTGYWQYSSLFGKEFTDVLNTASGFNLYDKAYSRNEGLYPLYMFPHGSPGGVFGDGSEDSPSHYSVSILNRLAQMYQDSRLKWESEAIGSEPGEELFNYFYGDADLAGMPPVDLPDGRWFQDIGEVAMHSELYDPDRVSLYFKSSPYGSYNHTHADQNSFVVKAFGESLAVEGGFFDSYTSEHMINYGRQTFASNAITIDRKKGQPTNDIDADGKILGFVTHPDFDATSGDASAAYAGMLSRADRKIIYVRPSTFVVVDQLASNKPGGSNFEWWLHADDELDVDVPSAEATILKGNAGLKVKLLTPGGLTAVTEDNFLDQNGIERKPGGNFTGREQKHAAFVTPKASQATIVSTMQAYERSDGAPAEATVENNGAYLKLSFEDGSVVYVRTGTSGVVNAGSVSFDGAAVAFKGDTVLLVDGKSVAKDGVALITSSETATVVYGQDRLSVSGQADTQVAVLAPGLTRLRDQDSGDDIPQGGTAAEEMALQGVHWTTAGDTLNVQVEHGQRAFKLNDAPMPEPMAPVTLNVDIDGVPGTIELERHSDTEGNPVAWGKLDNEPGLYQVLEAPAGFLFASHGKADSVFLEADAPILLRGAAGLVKLKKMGADAPTPTVTWDDPDEKRETTPIVWKEAEAYSAKGDPSFTVYRNRPFLSGGAGVGTWVDVGSWGKWQLNVPNAGTYDLVVKYVSGWDMPAGQQSARLAMIGESPYYFETETTVDYGTLPEYWKAARVRTGKVLEPGPIDITLWNARGPMNVDWIGLIEVKDDEVIPTIPGNVALTNVTDHSVDVSWTASTDDVAVAQYAIYANGVQKLLVPAGGTLTATVSGLSTGQTYAITVRAVDSSGNRSKASAAATATLPDLTAPGWDAADALRIDHLFPAIAKLKWDEAEDNSGHVASYKLYRSDQPGVAVEVTGTSYDVTGLTPGASYTFKVEAKDAAGNESTDGPTIALTMPTTGAAGEYYETFDSWTTAANGNGWTFTRNFGTVVEPVTSPITAGKALKVLDNYEDPTNEWAVSPIVQKATTALTGKVTFETKFIANKVGYFEMIVGGSGTDLIRFTGGSDKKFGYWIKDGGTNKLVKLPNSTAEIPANQWMTLRFDADMDAKRYSITLQSDYYKTLTSDADFPGTLDKRTGTYRIGGLKFYDDNATVSNLSSFVFRPSRYTGEYLFDYATMFKTP
ncbi:DUF4962 domain-containing protein [Paenibacillus glycinis]|uniref:DUF4962 domain-containing protein n=1 Tax=Paenibacillus glycinis TaxID=2697035 RepID=A0ABW9XNC7_9BACL|nr:DUF4962 domain-containing protein [Paenibacillus glycinis]NBD23892.1 DUF4962 domain-containing protein [Paenibacillus glycinis]